MKLSELVKQRRMLQTSKPNKMSDQWAQFKSDMIKTMTWKSVISADRQSHLQTKLKMVTSAFGHVEQYMDETIAELTEQIKQLEQTAYPQSYKWYVEKKLPEEADPGTVEHKPIRLLERNHNILDKRMKLYNDWRFPGMCIQPRHGWVENIASCDPLYMVDYEKEHCETSSKVFNEQFQKKIRTYKMNVWHPKAERIFEYLPQNQFGFVLSFNWLNFMPREGIKQVYQEIFELLRPGGIFMHSYNNCEYHATCRLFEHGTHPYMTSSQIRELAQSAGLEYHFEHSDRGFDWLELRKPGELQSIRGGQALGKIEVDNRVELEKEQNIKAHGVMTREEYWEYLDEGARLGIDTYKNLRRNYSWEAVRQKVLNKKAQIKQKEEKEKADKAKQQALKDYVQSKKG